MVIGDRVRLAQVIGNVMDNAIRHATPGTVITAEVAPAPAHDGAVRVAVTDVGDTMAADAVPYLF